jgi:site-specific DNA recombinase
MSQNAIIYSRVSTDEQADSGYSLRDQEERLRHYCQRSSIKVLAHYQDDASAKTFDRPAFNDLLKFARANRQSVDVVLVIKWDRFSRNATDALSMIRTFDDLGIDVQAIDQPIDKEVPEQLLLLSIYVAAPEVENRRRSLSTKTGMRRAMKEGRWVTRPPFGYRRGVDDRGKPIIEPGDKASYVRQAFEMAARHTDVPLEELRRRLNREERKAGRKVYASRSNFVVMLQNPVYAGLVRVQAWKNEPEEVVEGLHDALVDRRTFAKVQERFAGKPSGRKWKLSEEVFLRGHLLCPGCGEPVTGSGSKGNGGRYWYYHCHRCKALRARASEVHREFASFLQAVCLPDGVREMYRNVMQDLTKSERAARDRQKRDLEKAIQDHQEKLFAVDEAYIEARIETDSYQRLKAKYKQELDTARTELAGIETIDGNFAEELDFAVSMLSDLPWIFEKSSLDTRREMLVRIWPDSLTYENGSFRTNPETDLIALISPEAAKTTNATDENADGVLEGCPTRIRTLNLLIQSQALCQLSYRASEDDNIRRSREADQTPPRVRLPYRRF